MKILLFIMTVFLLPSYAFAKDAQESPMVIELFTSQSCASCPPADKALAELAKQKNVIALGCHVSYWNHLQWKDALAHDFCDVRQHGIQGMRQERKIYTPQMVINGKYVFIGSNQYKRDFALSQAQNDKLSWINTSYENNLITLVLPQTETGDYRLWAYGYKKNITQHIGGGENSGRKIDYTNTVMTYSNLGAWDGLSETKSFEKPEGDIDGIAIFAQKQGYADIVAAGKLEF